MNAHARVQVADAPISESADDTDATLVTALVMTTPPSVILRITVIACSNCHPHRDPPEAGIVPCLVPQHRIASQRSSSSPDDIIIEVLDLQQQSPSASLLIVSCAQNADTILSCQQESIQPELGQQFHTNKLQDPAIVSQ